MIKKFLLFFCIFFVALNCNAEDSKLYKMYEDESQGIYALYASDIIRIDEMVDYSELFKKIFKPENKNNQYTTVFIFDKKIDFNKILSNKRNRITTMLEIGRQKPVIEYMGSSYPGNYQWASHESFCYIMNGQCVAHCFSNAYKNALDYKYNYKEVNQFKEIPPYSSIGDLPVCHK